MTSDKTKHRGILSKGNAKTLWAPRGDPHDVLIEAKGPKYRAYRQQWERTGRLDVVTDMPTQLDFELNPSCNMKCPMCTWSAVETFGQGRSSWMPIEKYTAIIEEAAAGGVQSINLCYVNEPLIRRDLPEFVAVAVQKGIPEVMFNTNGMLLTGKTSERLIQAGLTKLSVSLDAFTEPTYDKIRVGGDFRKVLGNIDKFLEVRAKLGKSYPLLKITFLRNKLNEGELKAFVNFWKDRCELLSIQNPANPFDGALGKERSRSLGLPISVDVRAGSRLELEESAPRDKRCAMPFQRMTIRANGDVLPCCHFRGADLVVGNAFMSGVKAIWAGEAMREIRRIHYGGQYRDNDVCRRCMDNWMESAPDPNAFVDPPL